MRRLFAAALAAMLSTQALSFDAGTSNRYPSPDFYKPNVDSLFVRGKGSTGEIPGMGVTLPGTGGTFRSFLDRMAESISVLDYGAKCDGTPGFDDAPGIQAAINAAPGKHRSRVHVPGICSIGSTITIGNGSPTTISTVNSVTLEGDGKPFFRLGLPTSLGSTGSQLKWTGPAGGTMVRILGPSDGNALKNIGLDANSTAATCLRIISSSRGDFRDVSCANFTGTGLDLNTHQVTRMPNNQDSAQLAVQGNIFTAYQSYTTIPGTTAVSLDGMASDGTLNGYDTTADQFILPVLAVPGTNSTGFRFAYADQITINGLVTLPSTPTDGTSCGIKYDRTVHTDGVSAFPQNIVFLGQTDTGHGMKVCGEQIGAPLGAGNRIDHATTLDAQILPADPVDRSLSMDLVEPGTFPNGGRRITIGQNIVDRGWRNAFINPLFTRASRGTSFSSPASGSYLLDNWRMIYDGTMNAQTVSRVPVDTATPLPTEARYAIRLPIGNQTGGNLYQFCQRVEDVTRFSGRYTNFSAYMRGVGGSPSVRARIRQNFGAGGSATVEAPANEPTAAVTLNGGNWQRFSWMFQVIPTTGQTIGDGSYTEVCLELPVNYSGSATAIDLALPQYEFGMKPTAFETRPAAVDDLLAARTLQVVGRGAVGSWQDNNGALAMALRFAPAMACASPTVTRAATAPTVEVLTPGDNAYTSTTTGMGVDDRGPDGAQITMGGFGVKGGSAGGSTTFRPVLSRSDFALASCE